MCISVWKKIGKISICLSNLANYLRMYWTEVHQIFSKWGGVDGRGTLAWHTSRDVYNPSTCVICHGKGSLHHNCWKRKSGKRGVENAVGWLQQVLKLKSCSSLQQAYYVCVNRHTFAELQWCFFSLQLVELSPIRTDSSSRDVAIPLRTNWCHVTFPKTTRPHHLSPQRSRFRRKWALKENNVQKKAANADETI